MLKAKPAAKAATVAEKPTNELVPVLQGSALIQQIETDVSLVPTDRLTTFFVQGETLVKRIKALTEKVRVEFIEKRREEGIPTGEDNQHRFFTQVMEGVGTMELTIQTRKPTKIRLVEAERILKEKGLWEDAVDLRVVGDNYEFYKFLRKHRADLKGIGIEIEEVLSAEKLDALVALKKLMKDEVAEIIEILPPTYALTAKLKPKKTS
jgi:hypothetical protein